MRYFANRVTLQAEQQSWGAAAVAGVRFAASEIAKLPTYTYLALSERFHPGRLGKKPAPFSDATLRALGALGVEMKDYIIAPESFHAHVAEYPYPKTYAGGPVDQGGSRERKLLEYFVSLELLAVRPTDVVIDVASERSLFPKVLRELAGAMVYRQDLVYAPGIDGDRIGGSAASMPVPDGFADKLVLHNSFEHFEGKADSDFIDEAWRVLKPGGMLCIVPLYVSDRYGILTDPLLDRRGIIWDEGADVIEILWCHNRFERFYDVDALKQRVLSRSQAAGFHPTIYHFPNLKEAHPGATMRLGLTMQKPEEHQ